MKSARLPACFSTLNRGKITLYIKKQYIGKLSDQDMEILINLFRDKDQLNVLYHGRVPCRRVSISSLNGENFVVKDYWHGGLFRKILRDYFWQKLRLLNELSICETAIERGINTIEIVAIVKNRILGPLYKCKLISKEIRDKIISFSDFIDYWALDYDLKDNIFNNMWISFRSGKKRVLKLKSEPYNYEQNGLYNLSIKLIDIFGTVTQKSYKINI